MSYTKYWVPFPFIDIYFIIWEPNALSKIHDHSKNGCHMFILKGFIREEVYTKKLSLIDMKYLDTFDRSYIDDNIGYHRIQNFDKYSYSLHIYHPRNHITKYFN